MIIIIFIDIIEMNMKILKGGKIVEFKDLEIFQMVAEKEQSQKQQKSLVTCNRILHREFRSLKLN